MKELKCYNGRCGIHSKSDNCLFAYTREGCPYRAATPPVADTGELVESGKICDYCKHPNTDGCTDCIIHDYHSFEGRALLAPQPVAEHPPIDCRHYIEKVCWNKGERTCGSCKLADDLPVASR